ncbi:hypothetical protein KSF_099740 [Reticulibacter mediterranei]|uniref:DUF4870 domain-containing protein n=1 Tax=Reticulibacter mediterranei TaxID=2778369 RepID=A0A8J3ISE3_9CHLR|nr:DUF4870 domain-containing protein [Reticulibacter mediterranei]GHO99926.1 hypothetical protein KSF_099740 [Reticulibacter mediterranei]
MENYSNEASHPYGEYRGAVTAQPLETPNGFQPSSPESYSPSASPKYQQQEPLSGSQRYYGYQQPYLAGYSSPYEKISADMRPSRVGWLSYLGGWVTGLTFLLLKKENGFVRFHAMQSLIFFGMMSIATTVLNHIPFLASIGSGLGFVSFICWIVLIVKAARGRYYKLPIIGDYAEKWANSLKDERRVRTLF